MGNAAMAQTAQPHWPGGAKVFFVEPRNGAEVSGPVKVVMGVQGIEIAPAGTDKPDTGHHHILIDTDMPTGEKALAPLPAEDNIKHFGKGQTETTLRLPLASTRCNSSSATEIISPTIRRWPRRKSPLP